MNSSLRLLKVFGISVELHITFILFFLLMVLWDPLYVMFLLMIFATVLMHELIHSLVAMGFSIHVPRITLTPIGGIASIEIPEDPKKELLVSLSGPLSNLALAGVIYAIIFAFGGQVTYHFFPDLPDVSAGAINPVPVLNWLADFNVFLALFNLIPGFPTDGGRVFRAVLALGMDYITATRVAVWVGRMVAVAMTVVGIFLNPWLIVIGVSLYFMGGSELEVVKIKHALRGLSVGAIAAKDLKYVADSMTMEEFLRTAATPDQGHYPVSDPSGKLVGVLHIEDLRNAADPMKAAVRDVMRPKWDVVDSKTPAGDALSRVFARDYLFVIEDGRMIGYVTPGIVLSAARFHAIVAGKATRTVS